MHLKRPMLPKTSFKSQKKKRNEKLTKLELWMKSLNGVSDFATNEVE